MITLKMEKQTLFEKFWEWFVQELSTVSELEFGRLAKSSLF